MRRVNFKFLLGTVVVVLVLVGGVHALHVYQYGKQAGYYKQLVEQLRNSTNRGERIKVLQRYTAMVQDDADSLEQLGTLLVETGQLRAASLPLATALNLYAGKDNVEKVRSIREQLVDVSLRTGRLPDAEHHLGILIRPLDFDQQAADRLGAMTAAAEQQVDASDRRSQSKYHEQQAACCLAQSRWEEARLDLELSVALDRKRIEPYAMLADLEEAQFKDIGRAVAWLHMMVRENPEAARGYMFRGTFRLRQLLEWDRTQDSERLAAVVAAERAEGGAAQAAGAESAEAGDVAAPESGGGAPQPAGVEASPPEDLLKELQGLALADARRAAELSTDDREVLLLAMQCEHRYRDLDDRAAAAAHLQAAKGYAARVIESCQQEFERRRAEFEAELNAPRAGGEGGNAAQGTRKKTLTEADLKRLKQEVYRPAAAAYNTLADIALFDGQAADAMQVLNQGLQVLEGEQNLLVNLANLQIASADSSVQSAAEKLIDTLQTQEDLKPLGDYLSARLKIAKNKLSEGLAELEDVRPDLNQWPQTAVEADLWIGNCHLQLGDPQAAVAAYDLVLERRPNSIPVQMRLVQALQQLGTDRDLDRALALNEDLLRRHSEIRDASDQLVLCFRYARGLKTKLAGVAPDNPAWERLLGYLRTVRAELGDSRSALAEMDLLEADVQLARRRVDEAEAVLRAAVERDPKSARLWAALVWVQDHSAQAKAGGDPGAAVDRAGETLAAAEAALSDPSPDDRVVLLMAKVRHALALRPEEATAEVQRRANEALAAEEVAATALKASPESEALAAERAAHLRLIEELGGLAFSIQDFETARTLFDRLREADPGDIGVLLVLFDLELRRTFPVELSPADLKAAQETQMTNLSALLDDIREISGEAAVWQYGKAVQAVLGGDNLPAENEAQLRAKLAAYDAAIAGLKEVKSQGVAASRLLFLEAEIHDRKQQLLKKFGDRQWMASFRAATDKYMEAFEAGRRTPEFIFKTLGHLRELGRDSEAADLLTRLGDQAPNLLETAQTAAVFSEELGRLDLANLAERYARRVTESDEGAKDPVAHLTYGDILLRQGRLDEAEQAYDRVLELSPANVQLWRSLIAGYGRIDAERRKSQPDWPQHALQQKCEATLAAARGVLNETDLRLLEGRTYTSLGSLGEARSRYEAELAKVPADLQFATVEQIQLLLEAAGLYIQQFGPADPQSFKTGEALLRRLDEEGPKAYESLRNARREQGSQTPISPQEGALAQAIPDARRVLSTLLMGRGGVASLDEALAVLDRNRAFGYTDADRRIEALIRSRMPERKVRSGQQSAEPSQREQAIALLESIISSSLRPTAADRLLLSTMHLSEYRAASQEQQLRERVDGPDDSIVAQLRQKAQRHIEAADDQTQAYLLSGSSDAVAADGKPSGSYVAALLQQIEIELLRDRTSEAHAWLSELKDRSGDADGIVPIEARILFAEGNRHDEVRALLAGLVDRATEENRNAARASVAPLVEAFGQQLGMQQNGADGASAGADAAASDDDEQAKYYAMAEDLLKAAAARSPSDQLRLAAFYGRHGRLDEGIALTRAMLDAAEAGELAATCAQLMGKLNASPDQVPELQGVLATARELHPDDIALKMLDADLRAWVRDASGAEALYREILADAPANGIAINNLAFLLASQKKQLDEALEMMNGLISRSGELPDLLDTRAYVHLQRGELQQALADLAGAVGPEGRPHPAFLFHEAQALLAAGKKEEAVRSWNRAERAGLTETELHPAEREAYREFKLQMASLKGVVIRARPESGR